MRELITYTIIMGILFILMGICIGSISYELGVVNNVKDYLIGISNNYKQLDNTQNSTINLREDIVKFCENTNNVEEATKCAVDLTKSFYKYNYSNHELEYSIEFLKEQGANCVMWNYHYSRIMQDLGYETADVNIEGVTQIDYPGHIYLIAWDERDYCEIDQTYYKCDKRPDLE